MKYKTKICTKPSCICVYMQVMR